MKVLMKWLVVLLVLFTCGHKAFATSDYYEWEYSVLSNPCAPGAGVCTDGSNCNANGPACDDMSVCAPKTSCKILMTGDSIALGTVIQSVCSDGSACTVGGSPCSNGSQCKPNGPADFSAGGFMRELDALNNARNGISYEWVGRYNGICTNGTGCVVGGSCSDGSTCEPMPYPTSAASGYWIAPTYLPGNNVTAPGIQSFFPTDITTYTPDIVIIYVGINTIKGWNHGNTTNASDSWGWGNDASYAAQQYLTLVDSIQSANPNVLIVLCKIAPFSPTLGAPVNGALAWPASQLAAFNRFVEQIYEQGRILWPKNLVSADVHSAVQSTGSNWDKLASQGGNYSNYIHLATPGYVLGAKAMDNAIQGVANPWTTTELYYPPSPLTLRSNPCPAHGAGTCADQTSCTIGGAACDDNSTCVQKSCKILVTGNAVAAGGIRQADGTLDYSGGGIMGQLQTLAAANGKAPIEFVGRFAANPPTVPYATSALDGRTIADGQYGYGIQEWFPADLTTYNPDIVIVVAGGTELLYGADAYGDLAASTSINYLELLATIHYSSPRTLVVMTQIPTVSPTLSEPVNGAWEWVASQIAIFNWEVAQEYWQVQRLLAWNTLLVDSDTAIQSTGVGWDTINYSDYHTPSQAGYNAMVTASTGFWSKIGPLLP